MRSEFLTKQLDYVSTEERQLPLEAVFDIRSPPETHVSHCPSRTYMNKGYKHRPNRYNVTHCRFYSMYTTFKCRL